MLILTRYTDEDVVISEGSSMPVIFEMPSLSPTMEKGNLVKWCKKEGDEVEVGELIAEIDTDKATMEVESIYKGSLAKILVSEGTHDVPVRTPIAVIKQKKDTDEDVQKAIESALSGVTKPEVAKVSVEEPRSNISTKDDEPDHHQNSEKVKSSPLARRLANEYGIDISSIIGTGPHGRIVKQDILNVRQMKPAMDIPQKAQYVDESISSMRKVIAEKLTKTKQDVPHFYMNISANVTDLLNIRKQINDSGKFDTKITVNDLIVKATAIAMRDVPEVNVMWNNGGIRKFKTVDIAIAVAVENGLITPIIWSADLKPLNMISKEIKDLAKKAKESKLMPEQYVGGGITVSNLGMFAIDSFSSIINPPQGSILSIGPAQQEVIVGADGEIKIGSMMKIGYAVDHRVIDGAVAARFLENLKNVLENPILLLI